MPEFQTVKCRRRGITAFRSRRTDMCLFPLFCRQKGCRLSGGYREYRYSAHLHAVMAPCGENPPQLFHHRGIAFIADIADVFAESIGGKPSAHRRPQFAGVGMHVFRGCGRNKAVPAEAFAEYFYCVILSVHFQSLCCPAYPRFPRPAFYIRDIRFCVRKPFCRR